jgi:hypothetical protein
MSCQSPHWLCRGEAKFSHTKIALLETSFKKDIRTLAGEYRAKGYPESGFSNTTNRSISLNAISLCCGIVGNMFLLFNFTQIVRYIIALPVTIILWFISAGIVSKISLSPVLYVQT